MLQTKYLSSVENFKVDRLSRLVDKNDWTLNCEVVVDICKIHKMMKH